MLTDLEIEAEAALETEPYDAPVPEMPEWMLGELLSSVPSEPPTCACCGLTDHAFEDVAGEEPVHWTVPGVWGPEPVPVQPVVGPALAGALRVLEQIADADASRLDPPRALGEAEALTTVLHVIRRALLTRTQDVRERSLYEHLGFRTAAAWQRTIAPDTPRGEGTLARRLGALLFLRRDLTARQVSFTAAGKVGRAMAEVRPHLDRPDGLIDQFPGEEVIHGLCSGALDLLCQHYRGLSADADEGPAQAALLAQLEDQLQSIAGAAQGQAERVEQVMVLLAQHLAADDLPGALEQVALQLLPSVLEQDEREAQHKRGLSLKPNKDGTWSLKATLSPEVGEQAYTALAAEARRDPANPLDTHAREVLRNGPATESGTEPDEVLMGVLPEPNPWSGEATATGPDGEPLAPRTRGQRLHDAFGRLLSRYLSAGLGGTHGKVPLQVSATVSERTIAAAPGAPPPRGGSGRPLARSLLARWWCDADVTVLLMSRGWVSLGVVHQQRTLTATELKAARVQSGARCPGIGCCSGRPDPLTPLVPHHLEMFSRTGTTSPPATVLCCEAFHRDIHLGGRLIRLRDGRFITEDGYLHQPA